MMLEMLKVVRKLIEGGFTNKGLATNAKGDFVSPFSDEAVNFSLTGALNRVTNGRSEEAYIECLSLIKDTIMLSNVEIPDDQTGVLSVIDQAISRMEGQQILLEKRYKTFSEVLGRYVLKLPGQNALH